VTRESRSEVKILSAGHFVFNNLQQISSIRSSAIWANFETANASKINKDDSKPREPPVSRYNTLVGLVSYKSDIIGSN